MKADGRHNLDASAGGSGEGMDGRAAVRGIAGFGGVPPGAKPLRMSELVEEADAIQFYAARFPAGVDLKELSERGPLTVKREVPEIEDDEEAGGAIETVAALKRATGSTLEFLPWRITTSDNRAFVGRRDGLDSHSYFLVVESEDAGELIPLNGWYSFHHEVQNAGKGSSDLAERKRRAALAKERDEAAKMSQRNKTGNDDDDDEEEEGAPDGPRGKRRKEISSDAAAVEMAQSGMEALYGEDALGFHRAERKRLKSLMKARDEGVLDVERENNNYGSALAFGQVKKPKVDWDFEGDGKASDDEDNLFGSDAEGGADGEGKPGQGSDFDSSDDEDRKLTKFGQKMSRMLNDQREKEADDELAGISDDAEDEESSPAGGEHEGAASGGPGGADGPGSTGIVAGDPNAAASAAMHVQQFGAPPPGMMPMAYSGAPPGGSPGMMLLVPPGGSGGMVPGALPQAYGMHGAALGIPGPRQMPPHGASGFVGVPGGQPGPSGHQLQGERAHVDGTWRDGSAAGSRKGPGSTASSSSTSTTKSPSESDADLRQEVESMLTRTFTRHGGRITVRMLMEELKLNSKGRRFQMVKELINVMCVMDTSPDSQTKFLEIKEEYKTK